MPKKSNYVIWKYESRPGDCSLKDITGFEKTYRLHEGTTLQSEFSKEVSLHMHPDFPKIKAWVIRS
ncbi:MAG TPA: hypothetical protein VN132_00155 [Bdellovibrio sp.]|nr:hypothetical protein [Bdellovibrio sp.]